MLEARTHLEGTEMDYYALSHLPRLGLGNLDRLPVTVKILLEMLLRDERAPMDIVTGLARWAGGLSQGFLARVDNATEVAYLHHGGVLQMILRARLAEA